MPRPLFFLLVLYVGNTAIGILVVFRIFVIFGFWFLVFGFLSNPCFHLICVAYGYRLTHSLCQLLIGAINALSLLPALDPMVHVVDLKGVKVKENSLPEEQLRAIDYCVLWTKHLLTDLFFTIICILYQFKSLIPHRVD